MKDWGAVVGILAGLGVSWFLFGSADPRKALPMLGLGLVVVFAIQSGATRFRLDAADALLFVVGLVSGTALALALGLGVFGSVPVGFALAIAGLVGRRRLNPGKSSLFQPEESPGARSTRVKKKRSKRKRVPRSED